MEPSVVEKSPVTATNDEPKPKKKKKKMKGGVKRKPKHTGKKQMERMAAVAAKTMEHSHSSEKFDGEDDIMMDAEELPMPNDTESIMEASIQNRIIPLLATEESTHFNPHVSPDKDARASDHIDSTEYATCNLPISDKKSSECQTSLDINKLDIVKMATTAVDDQLPQECQYNEVESPSKTLGVYPENYQDHIGIHGSRKHLLDTIVSFEPQSTEINKGNDECHFLGRGGKEMEGVREWFAQSNPPYPNPVCHTYSLCAWQMACRFHQRKNGCGCWFCPLPQQSCCCAHAPMDCVYHSLPFQEYPSWSPADRPHDCSYLPSGDVWRGPFIHREQYSSALVTPTPVGLITSPSKSPFFSSPSHHSPKECSSFEQTSSPTPKPDIANSSIVAHLAGKQNSLDQTQSRALYPDMAWRSSCSSPPKPTTTEDLAPAVSVLFDLTRQSRSHSESHGSTHAILFTPSAVVEKDLSTSPPVTPINKDTQIGMNQAASFKVSPDQAAISPNALDESFTERKSYAQIAWLGVEPPNATASIEGDKKSPSIYFDAKQIMESSPDNSNPSLNNCSRPASPISVSMASNQSLASRQIPATHLSTDSNACNISPPESCPSPLHPLACISSTLKPSKETARDDWSQQTSVARPKPCKHNPRDEEEDRSQERSPTSSSLGSPGSSRTISPVDGGTLSGRSSCIPKDDGWQIGNPGPSDTDSKSMLTTATDGFNPIENLRSQFGTPTYSDIQILVGSPSPHFAPKSALDLNYEIFYVHMAILSSSPFLRQLLDANVYHHNDGLHYIHAMIGPSFNAVPAFSMALQYLYSAPLITAKNLRDIVLKSAHHGLICGRRVAECQPEVAMVHFALCYAVSGAFLNTPNVLKRGIELSYGLLTWNTVEALVHFGMAASTYMITCPELSDELIEYPNRETRSFNRTWPPKVNMSHIREFEDKWPGAILDIALEYIADAITADFIVYERAQSEFAPSRIPEIIWTLPNSHCSDGRLEHIQFGSRPSFAETAPKDKAIVVASAMLLTLPYETFRKLLIILKRRGTARMDLILEVIRLRELRRLQAIRKYQSQVWPPGAFCKSSLEELAYREMIFFDIECADQNTNASQASVTRVWVGLGNSRMVYSR